MPERFFSPCPRGLEAALGDELARVGAAAVAPVDGGVGYEGELDLAYRANLESRLASRVLWRVGGGSYRDERELNALARAIDWPKQFRADRTIRVDVAATRSPLRSLEFATLTVKDAVCDRFRDEQGKRPSVDKRAPDVRVHAYLTERDATFYLDTSGEPLFKRGWRQGGADAPLRENLAAGIIMLTGWQPGQALLDPMCGGATLLIEAAAMARGRAPGARRSFGFEKLSAFQEGAWEAVKREASEAYDGKLELFGSDTDPKALNAARRNLAEAGIERWVRLERSDILERSAPAPAGVMVANPPYGERMGSAEELAAFYPRLGTALKTRFAGWRCFFFTADLRMPKLIGLQPSRRTPLWNGALECRLYEFAIVSGSHRR